MQSPIQKKSWITKPTSQSAIEDTVNKSANNTNTSDDEHIENEQYTLEGSPTRPCAKFLIQRFGYQEAKYLRQLYLTQKINSEIVQSPLKDMRLGNNSSSAFKVPIQKSSAAQISDFLMRELSPDSSECPNLGKSGVASPETPCTSANVYAASALRRRPGRPRTRPDVLRPQIVGSVPSSVPDLEDQSLGGLLRKSVFNFIQTGKYDDFKFCISDQSVSGQQIKQKLQSRIEQSTLTYKMGLLQVAKQLQRDTLQKEEQTKYSKSVVTKLYNGYEEWLKDSKKVDQRIKKLTKNRSKKCKSKIVLPTNLLNQVNQEMQGKNCCIQFKGRLDGNELKIIVPRKATPCSISIEDSNSDELNSQKMSSQDNFQ